MCNEVKFNYYLTVLDNNSSENHHNKLNKCGIKHHSSVTLEKPGPPSIILSFEKQIYVRNFASSYKELKVFFPPDHNLLQPLAGEYSSWYLNLLSLLIS